MATGEGNSAPPQPDRPGRTAPAGDGPTRSGEEDAQLLRRFAADHDEEAFAALVRRHGPLVLGVCRRVLNDRHEAEDAFQATFLVLACKAPSLARPELLAHWLYGVAYRTATKARGRAARRRRFERQAAIMQSAETPSEEEGRELRAVLDDELSRLPEKYRTPLVLCYLGGKTNEEAARLLGRPPGSMSRLLARGRELLRARLTRLGLTFDLRHCGRFLAQHDLPVPALPDGLAESTAQMAVLFAAGQAAAAGTASPAVRAAAEEVLRALGRARRRWVAVVLAILLAVLGAGALVYALRTGSPF